MFARVFALLPLALLASAAHLAARNDDGYCNTGEINCCNDVQTFDQAFNYLAANNLIDAALSAVGNVGFQCSPLTAVGVGSGSSCTSQTACCTGNTFNGLITVGCNNINAPL